LAPDLKTKKGQQLATETSRHMNIDRLQNRSPFKRAFACGGVLLSVIIIILIATGVHNLSYAIGYVGMNCFVSSLSAGMWGRFAKKKWQWGDYAARVIGFVLLFGFLSAQGRANP
jgi:hypothetical protein